MTDLVRGPITWDPGAAIGDFVIMRSNGHPVYNFCVAVDDYLMNISHVIRAEEHLSNTVRQLLVLQGLGATPPQYAHCSLILAADRSKLSKRHGATSVSEFRHNGFHPSAMVNYLGALGFNDGTTREIYNPDDLRDVFSLNRLVLSPAVFDMKRLTWINKQHLSGMSREKLQDFICTLLLEAQPPLLHQPSAASSASTDKLTIDSPVALVVPNTDLLSTDTALAYIVTYLSDMIVPTDPKSSNTVSTSSSSVMSSIRSKFNEMISYPIEETLLLADRKASDLVKLPNFMKIVEILCDDDAKGIFPVLLGGPADLWSEYLSTIESRSQLTGKALYLPIRFALTGRMTGADVGEQLKFVEAVERASSPTQDCSIVTIKKRIELLRNRYLTSNK
jgi:glutamyl-tRNA synthetase